MNHPTDTIDGAKALTPFHNGWGGVSHLPYKGEKIHAGSIAFGIKAIFVPSHTRTLDRYGELEKFTDLDVESVRRIVRALIINVNGTLTSGNEDSSPEVVEKLREIRAKMAVCIFCMQGRNWPLFEQLDIPVAKHLPDKSDPRAFDVAVQLYLQGKHSGRKPLVPREIAMVGNNRLTDGACRQIGMQYIHVNRRPGPEGGMEKLVRLFGEGINAFHRKLEKMPLLFSQRAKPDETVTCPHPLVQALYQKRKRRDPL